MIDHTVRLERMLENDRKRQKQALYPTFGFIVLGYRIDRELKAIDPEHVTGSELSKGQLERHKRKTS